ncbi:hypothetical protein EBZ80_01320 [bacterium]|nr:hypothetical protein [bacterium]
MRYLDHGNFGVVMEDDDTVLKILLESCPEELFRNEDAVLSRLPVHPGLPRYLGKIVEPFRALRIERARGENLFDLIDQNRLSNREKKTIARAIAETVAVLHEHGIVHGDLKPENIVVDRKTLGHKLIDFGGAVDAASPDTGRVDFLTGTIPYMAPEVRAGNPPTAASDVYSYGLLLFVLFYHTHPSEFDRNRLDRSTREGGIIRACTRRPSLRPSARCLLRMWDGLSCVLQ